MADRYTSAMRWLWPVTMMKHVRWRPAARLVCGAACLVSVAGLWGCASSEGPQVLTIESAQYAEAFDAAIEAAREAGMPVVMKDRRGGVIETQPDVTGSLLEPWRTDNASLNQATANTIAYQRRRTRFEFTPTGFQPSAETADTELTGPDVISSDAPAIDLTQTQGALELRAWVYVERSTVPGVRRSTWSRSKTTVAKLVAPEGETGLTQGISWQPVTRDVAYERRLLAQVQRALAEAP